MKDTQTASLPIITINSNFHSVFKTFELPLDDMNGMFISNRQNALNFRHRKSKPGYQSDWHVAGDPTLLLIQQGCLEITLRSGESKLFNAGEQFIAADFLPDGVNFGTSHGHSARVVGKTSLQAVHIKLSNNPQSWLEENSAFLTVQA
ncbi:hypothetical protein J3L16_03280 [Alteromonas sp. 5E99-2]|uniref:hypothetical protein n=1 Tax=Alteromonas sp. 5E99-2 TaxID=2817683 RepID=UPI001A992E07|nr:hypothetical protein [Alteromonas sp. 5E99-2]MBO1254707.1 hypothetical protein [Alteromonas sp. 5E99-2]